MIQFCESISYLHTPYHDATKHSMLSLRGSGLVLNKMYAFHLSTERHSKTSQALNLNPCLQQLTEFQVLLSSVRPVTHVQSSAATLSSLSTSLGPCTFSLIFDQYSLLKRPQLFRIPLQKLSAQLLWHI
jgi:hypothetical protein